MFKKIKELLKLDQTINNKKKILFDLQKDIQNQSEQLEVVLAAAKTKLNDVEITVNNRIREEELKATNRLNELQQQSNNLENIVNDAVNNALNNLVSTKQKLSEDVSQLQIVIDKQNKLISKNERLAKKHKIELQGIQNLLEKFPAAINFQTIEKEIQVLSESLDQEGIMNPIVNLDFHHKASKKLRSDMNANNKLIKDLLVSYKSRYTTKANLTIYELMVIGLQAELQNILYTLTYSSLDKGIDNAKALITKYLHICGNGNASILPTITRFLNELEPLFLDAIRIEYRYYVQKEQEKEEQKRIREQMRQEAEEKRQLELERKKLEKEEEKFLNQIEKNKALLSTETDETKISALELRIKELELQFNQLEEQKEEIIKRANGKAGHVYIISNLGSFGSEMFKIGMTRRLDPLDRVDELGDASVPFKFDIHAMIFSNDAVGLEHNLHQALAKQRVNKINLRKEFFYCNVNELQKLVQEIDSTAEFTLTMKALEYYQSQSLKDEIVTAVYIDDEESA